MAYSAVTAALSVGVAKPLTKEPMATTGARISHLAAQTDGQSKGLCKGDADGAGAMAAWLALLVWRKYPPNTNKKATMTKAGSKPAKNMVLMGTRAMMAYMMSGTEGASKTPKALALVTKLIPRFSG